MPLWYSVQLCLPIEKIEQALLTTAQIADARLYGRPMVTVTLLDGRTVTLPFTRFAEPYTVALEKGKSDSRFALDTTLLFPLDDAIQAYSDKLLSEYKAKIIIEIDRNQYASIGNIDLTVEIGYRFARFSYVMPTNAMSLLLIASQSMRDRFAELAKTAGAVASFIFKDEDTYPHLLSDPNQIIPVDLDEEQFFTTEEDDFNKGYWLDIDRFTEAILAAQDE